MQTRRVLHFDSFSSLPNRGNPAGIVLDADDLSEAAMQDIARSVGFNETVFVMQSDVADYRLRFFTPGHEMNLCGHATVASMFCMNKFGIFGDTCKGITIETKAGVLPIRFETRNSELFVTMKQDQPMFTPFTGSVSQLASSLGLSVQDIDEDHANCVWKHGHMDFVSTYKGLRELFTYETQQSHVSGDFNRETENICTSLCFENY